MTSILWHWHILLLAVVTAEVLSTYYWCLSLEQQSPNAKNPFPVLSGAYNSEEALLFPQIS